MASAFLTGALLLLSHRIHAYQTDISIRANGYCRSLDIPVSVMAPTAIYDIPPTSNDQEATAWAIWDADRTNPHDYLNIVQNTSTSDTFNIHANLCIPKSSGKTNILQIATHGIAFDSRYWDVELQPDTHSYVEAALQAGYAVFTYDRLGTGQSDRPNAYTVVQGPVELEILRQLTLMARDGSLYTLAANQHNYTIPAFTSLTPPSKVVHVGHSWGSVLTAAFMAKYANLTDGTILTAYLLSAYFGSAGSTSFSVGDAASHGFNRSEGYLVPARNGVQNIFFGGNLSTAYTPEFLEYADAIKQPATVGEFASAYNISALPGPDFESPVQLFLAEFDFYVCRGDCKGLANATQLNETYPNASAIEVYIQPNAGHGLPLHNNATAGFEAMFDFLERYGL
ncbi:alpha/beta-hydrolase [Teratosphaeria nubilosa]|uniref:Alpha/beta-hydrolase n=1 Tax=Teratosphaeria nubilosa TaxID=161662 RepID=A0A6G1LED6_9PEZI|nr:alpha/beta-hydrolase [Teratosphaeria nubilosa]